MGGECLVGVFGGWEGVGEVWEGVVVVDVVSGSVVVVSAVEGEVEDNEVVELDGESGWGGCRWSGDFVGSERC